VSAFVRTLVGDLLNYSDFEEKRPKTSLHPLELVVQALLFLARRRASVRPTVRDSLGIWLSSRSLRDLGRDCGRDGDLTAAFFVIHFHIELVLPVKRLGDDYCIWAARRFP
jgi:hypothetical protein